MNRKLMSSVILPLVGMVIVLGMAYGFDILIKALKEQNSITPNNFTEILLWVYAATNLLVNGSLLLLFWGVMTKTTRSPWVGGVYLLVGIDMVVSLGFYRSVGYLFYRPTIGSCLYYAMGGIGMIGLFILILPAIRSIHKD